MTGCRLTCKLSFPASRWNCKGAVDACPPLRYNGAILGTVRTIIVSIMIGVSTFLIFLLALFILSRNASTGHNTPEQAAVSIQLGVSNL